MHLATQQFINVLEEKELKYTYQDTTESGKDRLLVNFKGDNLESISINFFFSDDNEDVGLRIFNIAKIPAGKTDKILHQLNALNNKYRFAKFCLDTNDNTVQLEMDTPFRGYEIGEVCYEILLRALQICDDSYPELARAIWA